MEYGLTKERQRVGFTARKVVEREVFAQDAGRLRRGYVLREVGEIFQAGCQHLGACAANFAEGMDGGGLSRHDRVRTPHVFGGEIMAPAQLVGLPQNICPD